MDRVKLEPPEGIYAYDNAARNHKYMIFTHFISVEDSHEPLRLDMCDQLQSGLGNDSGWPGNDTLYLAIIPRGTI